MEGSHLNSEILEKALDIIRPSRWLSRGQPPPLVRPAARAMIAGSRRRWLADGKRIKPVEVDLLASRRTERKRAPMEPRLGANRAQPAGDAERCNLLILRMAGAP